MNDVVIISVVHGQLTIPDGSHGNQGNNYCSTGFEMHGRSCYRFINMLASWTDAWVSKTAGIPKLVS